MKRVSIFILGAFLLVSFKISAQNVEPAQLNVIYKQLLKHEPTNPEGAVDVTFVMLSVGDTRAVVEDYAAYKTDSLRALDDIDPTVIEQSEVREAAAECFFLPKIYLDLERQEIEHHEPILPNRYYYTESFPTDWELGEGSKEIAGYLCHEAKLDFAGRQWTAWYTEEIPLPYGPWKLAGLPGLVLAAEDSTGEITFELAEIRNKRGIVPPFVRPESAFEINREGFLELYHAFYPEQESKGLSAGITSITVRKGENGKTVVFANDGIVLMRSFPNGFIFLEKE